MKLSVFWRVAPVPTTLPSHHDEGAPGPSPLGTGEVRFTCHRQVLEAWGYHRGNVEAGR